eukprot:TRINITY_DN10888_c0_g4_i1.p1 TRINITY_DN10888_c0_g4~~TRINITY_DN10888_c0_g4_i1.p1  ORF type:complete len:576 (-),score=113.37 TRINITY_DN10888_c0_g4_i1:73-1800(-)
MSSWLAFLGLAVCGAAIAVPPREHALVLHLKQHNLENFERRFWNIATPGHPNYLQHLSAAEIASEIGATDAEIESARNWLLSIGADETSIEVSALRDSVTSTFRAVVAAERSEAPGMSLAVLSSQKPACVEFIVRRDAMLDDAAPQVSQVGASKELETFGEYTVSNIKKAYGIPLDLQATNSTTLQMVWGPGTFGYSTWQLKTFKEMQCPKLNTEKVKFDTSNQGTGGGDNWGEGNLDTQMIAAFGLNVETLVSNTNTSASTEEGNGFGQAMLDFLTQLAARPKLPHVLSLSLGSLSAASCDKLCDEAAKLGQSKDECNSFLQTQRQVCMFMSTEQVQRIDTALQVLGARGVSVFGSSGDGGSHFSFGRFQGGAMADVLNKISCKFQMPVYPTTSAYIVSVGGTMWKDGDSSKPITWSGSGGGSGGGFSWQMDRPTHQDKAVEAYLATTSGLPPNSSFNAKGRAFPDISSVAVMGTSQSSPMTAGIFSLLIDQRLNAGLPPLGFVAPTIWKVAQEHPGEAFESVPEGNSKTSCDNGFPSAAGWDPNTGWGRPVWAGLVKHFVADLTDHGASEIVV